MSDEWTWIDPDSVEIPGPLVELAGGNQLLASTMLRRGLTAPKEAAAFLDPSSYSPAAPGDLAGVPSAVERLLHAIRAQESICVWGDFDVDGQTSTTVLVSTLEDLGGRVSYHIPVRERESHGVNLPVLRQILDAGVRVILTCDTGIQAHEAIEYARNRNVDFIVTDHHDLPPELPRAHAIVNPKLMDAGSPLRELPGVGCAYMLAQALYESSEQAENAARHLDLAALGIVADLAVLRGDVRYLLQLGLETLRRTPRLGLLRMMELAEIDPETLSEQEIGFELGPRLNALGRLADANLAVEFLTTQEIGRARQVADELEALNARRKLMTDQVFEAARAALSRDPGALRKPLIILSRSGWPAGVIGIVAGRLAERYGRPAVLISESQNGEARGSARSVEGIDISAAIQEQHELLLSHGGHPMAAGFSIETHQIPRFAAALARAVDRQLGGLEHQRRLIIDAYLDLEELNLEFIREMERLAPFGPGNPRLTLATRGLRVVSHRTLGRSAEHLRVRIRDEGGFVREVLWWHADREVLPAGVFDLAFHARSTMYRGQPQLQMEWVAARTHRDSIAEIDRPGTAVEIHDLRHVSDPGGELERLSLIDRAEIWNEVGDGDAIPFRGRNELDLSSSLVIWSIPPGPDELLEAIQRVRPSSIYLFAEDPGRDSIQTILEKLAGAAKYALRTTEGQIQLSKLAAAISQRVATVRLGLAELEHAGVIEILEQQGDQMRVALSREKRTQGPMRGDAFQKLVRETAAFRSFYREASTDELKRLIRARKR